MLAEPSIVASMPPSACDAHCHVFGPARRFPYAPDRAYTPDDAPWESLRSLHHRLGIQRAVLVQASCHGTDNRAMLDAMVRGDGNAAGVAMVDRTVTDDELAELHDAGVRGVRFNFVAHLGGAPDLNEFHDVIGRIAPRGWHVVLHFDAVDIHRHLDTLRALPLRYVIDHMGRVDASLGVDQPALAAMLELMTDDRCWVKISGAERLTAAEDLDYADVVPIARAIVAAAPDRVLWGTDWPHPNVRWLPDDAGLVRLLGHLVPDEGTRRRILVDNPCELYEFR